MKKYRRILALGIAALLALPGCAGPGAADTAMSTPPASQPATQEASTEETSQISDAPQPSHITREVNEYFRIDADIDAPARTVAIYRAELPELGTEQVDRFMTVMGDQLTEPEDYTSDSVWHVIEGATEKGGSFIARNTVNTANLMQYGLSYSPPYDPDTVFPYDICVVSESLLDPCCQQARREQCNVELYTQPRPLSCGTEEDARQAISDALDAMDISLEVEYNYILYLDHKTMNEAYNSDVVRNEYIRTGRELPPMEPLTEADDRLYLNFFFRLDGIRISSQTIGNTTEAFFGAYGSSYFTQDGLENFYFMNPFHPAEVLDEVDVISPEEACDIAEEMLGSLVDGRSTLMRAALEYYPTQDRDRWILKPIWTFTVWTEHPEQVLNDGSVFGLMSYYHIDAVTGEEI